MFALVLFILFLVAVGVLYALTRKAMTPEAAAATVEAKAKEAEADAQALVDNAETVVTKYLTKLC